MGEGVVVGANAGFRAKASEPVEVEVVVEVEVEVVVEVVVEVEVVVDGYSTSIASSAPWLSTATVATRPALRGPTTSAAITCIVHAIASEA